MSLVFEVNKKYSLQKVTKMNCLIIKSALKKFTEKQIRIKKPNDLLIDNKKFCGILQEVIKFNKFDFLIVGIGLNTNVVPQNKSFKSTSLKNIVKKNISNQKILKSIIKAYEKFLNDAEIKSFSELKRKYK